MKSTTYFLFIFLLIFSPLAFGIVEQWSLTLMEGLSFFALSLYLLERLIKKKPLYKVPGLVPLLLFLCYLLLQILPLPGSIINLLSPETFKIYQDSILILDTEAWLSFSLNKKAGLQEFFRYSAYVCFYFLTIQLLTDKKRLKKTVNITITFLTLFSVYAIIQKFTSTDTIYWLLRLPNNSQEFGSYVNHNHFAGLVEMVLPITLSLFLYLKPQPSPNTSFRQKIIETFEIKKSNIHILLGFSTVLLITAIILSLSRGAVLSICLAFMVFFFLLAVSIKQKLKASHILAFIIVVLISISWFGWESSFERFGELENKQGEIYESRLDFWKDSVNIAKDFPITGTGFGSFSNIYPRYRTFSTRYTLLTHAHNDYIELLVEGGLIGAFLVIWFLFELFFRSARVYMRRKDLYSKYLFLGCATGLLSILFHSFTDFNLHIGANGLFFFFLSGVLISSANTKIKSANNKKTLLKTIDSFSIKPTLVAVTLIMLVIGLTFNGGILMGELYYDSIEDIQLNSNTSVERLKMAEKQVDRALMVDHLEGKYFFALANLKAFQQKSGYLENYKKAIYSNPTNGEYLQRIGLVLAWSNKGENTNKLLKSGCQSDIHNPEKYKTYADWLFSIDKKERAVESLKKALSVEHKLNRIKVQEYIYLMVINDISENEMRDIMPPRVMPMLVLADYLSEIGKDEKAEKIYLKALTYADNEPKLSIWDFHKVYKYYEKSNNNTDALKILHQTVNYFPDHPQARIWIAGIFEKMGNIDGAIVEYKKVLSIDPKNRKAQRELARIANN